MVRDMLDRYIKAGQDESLCMMEATVDVGEADREVGPARCVGSMDRHDAL